MEDLFARKLSLRAPGLQAAYMNLETAAKAAIALDASHSSGPGCAGKTVWYPQPRLFTRWVKTQRLSARYFAGRLRACASFKRLNLG
jgi:hypothetical protein